MNEIGKEYGAALYQLACENHAERDFAKSLERVAAVFAAEPDYLDFLASPGIPIRERQAAIEAAFGGTEPEYVVSCLQLMCGRGRLSSFPEAAETFCALLAEAERVTAAKVTSAVPLTEAEKQKLRQRLEARCGGTVQLDYLVDEALLGGLIVEIGGKVMDGSLRHRMREIKEVIST